MRTESEVYGDFHTLRTFHNDLFQSINRNDAAPYPALDTLFDQLFAEANYSVGARVNYDSTYWKIQEAIAGKEEVPLKEPFTSMQASLPGLGDSLTRFQQQHRDAYFALRLTYQDSCKAHGVGRCRARREERLRAGLVGTLRAHRVGSGRTGGLQGTHLRTRAGTRCSPRRRRHCSLRTL